MHPRTGRWQSTLFVFWWSQLVAPVETVSLSDRLILLAHNLSRCVQVAKLAVRKQKRTVSLWCTISNRLSTAYALHYTKQYKTAALTSLARRHTISNFPWLYGSLNHMTVFFSRNSSSSATCNNFFRMGLPSIQPKRTHMNIWCLCSTSHFYCEQMPWNGVLLGLTFSVVVCCTGWLSPSLSEPNEETFANLTLLLMHSCKWENNSTINNFLYSFLVHFCLGRIYSQFTRYVYTKINLHFDAVFGIYFPFDKTSTFFICIFSQECTSVILTNAFPVSK